MLLFFMGSDVKRLTRTEDEGYVDVLEVQKVLDLLEGLNEEDRDRFSDAIRSNEKFSQLVLSIKNAASEENRNAEVS